MNPMVQMAVGQAEEHGKALERIAAELRRIEGAVAVGAPSLAGMLGRQVAVLETEMATFKKNVTVLKKALAG